MKRNYILFYVVFSLLAVFSCNKEEAINPQLNQDNLPLPEVKAENGIIKFQDESQFVKTIGLLQNLSDPELNKWQRSIPGFTSFRMAKSNEEFEPDFNIESPVFGAIVNKDGVFIVGDHIHKISQNKEYIIKDGCFSTLEKINSGLFKSSSNVITHEITDNIGMLKFSGVKYKLQEYANNKRLRISAYSQNFALYCCAGIQVVHEHKKTTWFYTKWLELDMYYAKVEGTAYSSVYPAGFPYDCCFNFHSGWDSGSNTKRVDKDLVWGAGAGMYVFTEYIEAIYTCEPVKGYEITYYIRWE